MTWGRVKLPFAEYSVARPPQRRRREGGSLFEEFEEIVWDDLHLRAQALRWTRRTWLVPRSSHRERRRRTPGSKFAGGHRIRDPPVPIPNTEVKPDTADGTAWETVWESRSLPALILKPAVRNRSGLFVCTPAAELRIWNLEFRIRARNVPATTTNSQFVIPNS